jgi:hypothetical protein
MKTTKIFRNAVRQNLSHGMFPQFEVMMAVLDDTDLLEAKLETMIEGFKAYGDMVAAYRMGHTNSLKESVHKRIANARTALADIEGVGK